MRDASRGLAALSGTALVVLSVLASLATGVGVVSADGGVSPSCADGTGGAVYVADSGLTVYENAPAVTHGTFEGGDTVSFAGTAISGAGNAAVRLEGASGTRTCLSDVEPGTGVLAVAPPDAPTVVFDSPVSKMAYRDPTYQPGELEADVAVGTAGPLTLQLRSTGLDPGTTVVVVDAGADRVIDRVNATATGAFVLDVPPGVQSVDLRVNPALPSRGERVGGDTRQVSPTETATRTSIATRSPGPTPTATEASQPEAHTTTATPTPTATEPSRPDARSATATPTPTPQPGEVDPIPTLANRTASAAETDEASEPVPPAGDGPLDALPVVVGIVAAVAVLVGAVRVLSGE